MTDTPIDAAHRAMEATPDDPRARLRFHERVMDAELFLLLETEPDGERLNPQVFDLDEGRFVLAFDRDDRLAEFLDAPAPYVALTGRRLVALLAGRGLGIGLNLGSAPSATLLPADAVAWMAEMGAGGPETADDLPHRLAPPDSAPEALVAALGPKLAAMSTRVASAHLVTATYGDDRSGLLLALSGVPPEARPAVAAAISEAVRFSGVEEGGLDVTFLDEDASTLARIRSAGLSLDLPRAPRPEPSTPKAPGTDPDRPPILR
jgi:hypothetical protein